jgi:hypothetical protein
MTVLDPLGALLSSITLKGAGAAITSETNGRRLNHLILWINNSNRTRVRKYWGLEQDSTDVWWKVYII